MGCSLCLELFPQDGPETTQVNGLFLGHGEKGWGVLFQHFDTNNIAKDKIEINHLIAYTTLQILLFPPPEMPPSTWKVNPAKLCSFAKYRSSKKPSLPDSPFWGGDLRLYLEHISPAVFATTQCSIFNFLL